MYLKKGNLKGNTIKRNRILQEYGKKKLKGFQNIVAIFKIYFIDIYQYLLILIFFFYICRASRICSRRLFLSCAIIVFVFNKNFSELGFRNRMFLKMKSNRTGVF